MKERYERDAICPLCGRHYTEHPALSRTDNKTYICPECGGELLKRKSRFGTYFLGCSNFPKCRYMENLDGERILSKKERYAKKQEEKAEAAPAEKKTARKTATKKTAAKKTTTKKTAAAKKSPAKKTTTKKTAARKKTAAKTESAE